MIGYIAGWLVGGGSVFVGWQLGNYVLRRRKAKKPAKEPRKLGYRVYWKDIYESYTLGVFESSTEAENVAKTLAQVLRPDETAKDVTIFYDDGHRSPLLRDYPESEFL